MKITNAPNSLLVIADQVCRDKVETMDCQSASLLSTRFALIALVILGLSACASFQDTPSQASLRDAASLSLPQTNASVAPKAQWWREFGDEQLSGLIEQALAANPSLKIAQARIVRAQAGAAATQGASGPQLSAGLDATHQKFTATGLYPPPLAGSVYDTGTAQLSGSWELDFFGKNHAALEAALGQVRAAQADAEAAHTLLASTLARTYLQWSRLQAQVALAQRLLAQRTQVLKLVRQRLDAGLDTQLELRLSEGTLPEARLQIETLHEQVTLASNAMAALIGQPNRALALVAPAQAAINIIVPPSVPADLLGRRADIAAARWRVEAASQDVASAKSQFYPNVNLVAFAGFSSIGLGRLLNADSQQWGLGPALRLPLFDGGRLRANLSGKSADREAAIESYNAVVIEAVREVADQITSAQAIARQQTEQRSAQDASERAYDIAQRRYAAGLGNFLSVLAAETAVLNQRRLGIDLNARSRDTQVALMRALGGGYRAELPDATAQN
jgi:NodT family efflux transporter outer membrane factor (OMF) lipoprotein